MRFLKLRFKLLRLYSRWQDWREVDALPFNELPGSNDHQRIVGLTRTTIRKYSPFKGMAEYQIIDNVLHFRVNMINRHVYWPVHSLTIPPERWVRIGPID